MKKPQLKVNYYELISEIYYQNKTVTDFAKKIQIKPRRLLDILSKGKSTLKTDEIVRISNALNIQAINDYFFTFTTTK